MDGPSSDLPRVAEFYRSRSVLVTGGTGFMGKVLVEKLLRSCPDIENIYVIIRKKKGTDAADRLKTLFELPLFSRLKEEQPSALEKVVAMSGDMMELGLGLSQLDRETLTQKVSVIFNVAATVRFDEPMKAAVLMNVRGTREVLNMALNMKQLKVVLHVSTTYCNTDHQVIEEKVYAPHGNWEHMIQAAETMDEHVLDAIMPKMLGFLPNTYTYSKSLGEHVVNDYGDKLPVIIFRPSIVISTYEEPMPGWVDNFNGPIGIMVAAGKGFVRTLNADENIHADYMPVDIAIKAMVVATWKTGTTTDASEVPLYNASSGTVKKLTSSMVMKKAKELASEIILDNIIWVPGGCISSCNLTFYLRTFFLHMLPAFFLDLVLMSLRIKPMLLKLHRRIFIANMALRYFMHHEWEIRNNRFMSLDAHILPDDRKDWSFDFHDVDIDAYLRNCFIGGKQYLLKEDMSNLPQAKKHYNRMYWIACASQVGLLLLLVWFVHANSYLGRTASVVQDYWSSLLTESCTV